jgi:hypothetical protein
MKNRYMAQPRMTRRGVVFTLRMERVDQECLISLEALERLSASKNIDASDADLMDIFHAFESTIDCAARRIAAERARDALLVLGPGACGDPVSADDARA